MPSVTFCVLTFSWYTALILCIHHTLPKIILPAIYKYFTFSFKQNFWYFFLKLFMWLLTSRCSAFCGDVGLKDRMITKVGFSTPGCETIFLDQVKNLIFPVGIPSICVWYYLKFSLCATLLYYFISFFVPSVGVIEDSQNYCILYPSFTLHLCQLSTASTQMSTHKRNFYSVRLFLFWF